MNAIKMVRYFFHCGEYLGQHFTSLEFVVGEKVILYNNSYSGYNPEYEIKYINEPIEIEKVDTVFLILEKINNCRILHIPWRFK
jgi:hypothetical protein